MTAPENIPANAVFVLGKGSYTETLKAVLAARVPVFVMASLVKDVAAPVIIKLLPQQLAINAMEQGSIFLRAEGAAASVALASHVGNAVERDRLLDTISPVFARRMQCVAT